MRYFSICLVLIMSVDAAFGQDAGESAPVIFVTHYLERGDSSTAPRSDQAVDAIYISAAPGEYEPATFSVRAGNQELTRVSARLSGDLKSDAGDAIPADAVQIRVVEPFGTWNRFSYQRTPNDNETQANAHLEMFLPLAKEPIDISAHTTRRFWLTLKVPEDASPGTYRASIIVNHAMSRVGPDLGREAPLKTLNYQVTVHPVRLATAAETGMSFLMYNDTAYYPPERVTPEYQKRVFEDMRDHGMTTTTLYLYPRVEDGKPADLATPDEKYLSFTQSMDLLSETKLVAPNMPVIWIGGESYAPEVWVDVLEERQRRGWPEILMYAVDEPSEEERNAKVRAFMKKFRSFQRQHPQYADFRVATAIGSSRGVLTVGHFYDLWIGCMAQENGESGLIADAAMMRKPLWTYDCMLAPVDAETDRYYFGVWAWVSGVKGCSHWAYYDGHPQLSYVYPASDEIISTIGWEAVREGIDDYRYLFTLRQLADRARAEGRPELTSDVDAIFARAKAMVTMDNYGRAYHQVTDSSIPVATAYQRPRVEPELDIKSYDRLRADLTRKIAELQTSIENQR